MANTYYKLMSQRLYSKYTSMVIGSLQEDLRNSAVKSECPLFDTTQKILGFTHRHKNTNIDTLHKYYLAIQIDKKENNQNKNIKKNEQNENYIVIDNGTANLYSVLKKYNRDNQVTEIQVQKDRVAVTNRQQTAEILGLKKELAEKHKYSGFCENSKNVIATILNTLSSPVETDFYVDSISRLYEWNQSSSSFVRNFDIEHEFSLLINFEFKNEKQLSEKSTQG